MSDPARVTSIAAISKFHAAVRIFQDEAQSALLVLDQQVAKALAYYDYDLPHYWKGQVRRCFDDVSRARTAYETCRMRTVAGRRPLCHEEKEALALAKRRVEYAQDQVEKSGHWSNRLHRVIDEFRAQTGRFQQILENDVEKTAVLLERTLNALESYLSQQPASEPPPPVQETPKEDR